ncbi:putative multidrug ABC transporter ATP-binding protein YbhF [Apilactobacillus kunkeei]|uniref:ABC transporter ATP-binding protein n=1 Tax=Apilactobacillus kunkeei TaxID=148814 RepID=UPI001C6F9620|nr:ABC transporter ATP-binding protein [Apilactobacillus kunkeei]MBX8455060.1 ABC transporter ATP-binding protein [Apilactobacillus kunkeei]QYU54597.1 ABC transporter ATP-binding protein [Apilactobacillus kunkeei]CAI2558702.1 putative multidrug ABC transporter ATP-binding protein YbhF [Apilactobacillus kunkeei]CAI2558798.1 putative multidrug ABC transporter ATP-binding protein YbhF [Apilactobacillus kunkeei]CAI2559192.1 putative multidrug ABC transporter ATP-binding protein YbhF [Apilactobacil
MTEKIISINNLKKKYGQQVVLNDVSFEVDYGQIVGLIGPSGAGKSTIIKLTLGMEKADSGDSEVFGIHMPNRKILNKMGYMAQSDSLYSSLSARENLIFFAKMREVKKEDLASEIDRVSQVVDLKDQLDKKVDNFSGGMKRRLSLAIALLGNPQLLILDEPTVGIDPALRKNIWTELGKLRDKGCSILVTTHVMDEAELTDRVALLIDGNIIADDTPSNLKQQYDVDSIENVFMKAEGDM